MVIDGRFSDELSEAVALLDRVNLKYSSSTAAMTDRKRSLQPAKESVSLS